MLESDLSFRAARGSDLEAIVALLADDALGSGRKDASLPLQASYRAAFESIGRRLFLWAIARANARHCHLLQLTSDKARPEAIRFYESLGFVASHEGMKLRLDGVRAAGGDAT